MSAFYDELESIIGATSDAADIICTVRKCYFYDFRDEPIRLWDGQGAFTDSDGNEWLGTVNADGGNVHKTPPIQDGRDGTSASYTLSMEIPNQELYEEMKADQGIAADRDVIVYLALFKEGEGLRPGTPLSFFRRLKMLPPKFSESVERDGAGRIIKKYSVSVVAKDGNRGRSNTPNGTYSDTIQKERARQLGVSLDRGCEYVASLAYRTIQVP